MGPRPDAASLWGKGTSFKRTVCDGSLLLGKRGSRDPRFAPAQTDQGCKRETRNHRCEMKRVGATLHEHTGRRLALSNRVPVPGRKESGECSPTTQAGVPGAGPLHQDASHHALSWSSRWPGRRPPGRWAPKAAESQTRKVGAASSAGKGPSCLARQTTEAACDLLTHRQPGRTRCTHARGHHSRDLLPSLFPCQCAFSSTFYLVRRPNGGGESTRAGGAAGARCCGPSALVGRGQCSPGDQRRRPPAHPDPGTSAK